MATARDVESKTIVDDTTGDDNGEPNGDEDSTTQALCTALVSSDGNGAKRGDESDGKKVGTGDSAKRCPAPRTVLGQ